jgi:hypothetical protein
VVSFLDIFQPHCCRQTNYRVCVSVGQWKQFSLTDGRIATGLIRGNSGGVNGALDKVVKLPAAPTMAVISHNGLVNLTTAT